MGSITSAFCSSAKGEIAAGLHSFLGTVTPTCTTTTSSNHVTGVGSMAGITLGLALSTSLGLPAGALVGPIDSTSSFYAITATGGVANSSGGTTGTLTVGPGDAYNFALIIPSPAGTFGAATTNYSGLSTDEVANGSGYTTGGFALTNTAPAVSGTQAFWSFSSNPSWTSATFTTGGGELYQNTVRRSGVTGRAIAVFNFGSQSVTGGTFTVLLPPNGAGTSILQLN